ncbi:lipoprotein [Candidatus Colwellia aromaticivorans]|uniref:lipoprotein n=1 Tax=Candidatus Colwellia aromaticivorans TaxID=2267621 RepID=UPI003CCC750B
MHSIKHFSFLFSCFLMSLLLCACGSKGDLYQVVEPEQSTMVKESQQQNTDTIKKPK